MAAQVPPTEEVVNAQIINSEDCVISGFTDELNVCVLVCRYDDGFTCVAASHPLTRSLLFYHFYC